MPELFIFVITSEIDLMGVSEGCDEEECCEPVSRRPHRGESPGIYLGSNKLDG